MSIRLIAGDCRDVLPTLAADSVQCVVSSPPYYGLRDYGTALWDGGDAACDHEARANRADRPRNGLTGGLDTIEAATIYRATCGKCGARRTDRQIGLESTPDLYLATMVAVFREVRRVLRPDGTCWVNMGDSYWNGGGEKRDGGHGFVDGGKAKLEAAKGALLQAKCSAAGLKPKDLLLMPARLALALQSDGWWVRSDIIWHKPNPMPESCTDRPTSAHEHIFLLTKRSRYYFDNEAIREPHTNGPDWIGRLPTQTSKGNADRNDAGGRAVSGDVAGRSCRNVWTIATHPYSQCHFATFPPELAERCIRAGTSERGCCAACGKPWRRTQETVRPSSWEARKAAGHPTSGYHAADGAIASRQQVDDNAAGGLGWVAEKRTTGWQPGCDHDAAIVPCTVLDPFAGAGTTLLVADRLQRDAIGIELNTAYTEMAMERCRADAPLFADMHPPPAEDPEDARMADLFAEAAE